jgi:hypothetical protein
MAPFVALALQLAPLFPPLLRHLAGDKAADVATEVVNIAQAVTGVAEPDKAIEALKANPEALIAFKKEMALLDARMEEIYLADRDSARKRDAVMLAAGRRNHRADFMFVLALFVVVGIMWALWSSTYLDEYIKGTITLILGRFLGYLDNIYSFEFGTTRGSKDKDATIVNLSGSSK